MESRTKFKSETKRGRISKCGTSEKEDNRGHMEHVDVVRRRQEKERRTCAKKNYDCTPVPIKRHGKTGKPRQRLMENV